MRDAPKTGSSGQIPLPLAATSSRDRDSLFSGTSNELALDLLDQSARWHNGCGLIVGEPASGKSHMLEVFARANEVIPLTPNQLYLSYAAPALAVDDLDEIVGDERAQETLFHLLNRAMVGELTVLLVSRSQPRGWESLLPDLKSRLAAATSATIQAPDDLLLMPLFVKHFADAQVEVKPAVIEFLVSRIERSYVAVQRAVAVVNSLALAERRPVTVPLVKQALEL